MSAPGLTVFQGPAGDRNTHGWDGAAAWGPSSPAAWAWNRSRSAPAPRRSPPTGTPSSRPRGPGTARSPNASSSCSRPARSPGVCHQPAAPRPSPPCRSSPAIAQTPSSSGSTATRTSTCPATPTPTTWAASPTRRALGLWDSGFGAGVSADRAILVGARDIDPPERELIATGAVQLVSPDQLEAVIAGRPVYVHIDCDVLEPGQVATEYLVPGGFTLQQLGEVCGMLARTELVGLEIGELEGGASDAALLADAIAPLLLAE